MFSVQLVQIPVEHTIGDDFASLGEKREHPSGNGRSRLIKPNQGIKSSGPAEKFAMNKPSLFGDGKCSTINANHLTHTGA